MLHENGNGNGVDGTEVTGVAEGEKPKKPRSEMRQLVDNFFQCQRNRIAAENRCRAFAQGSDENKSAAVASDQIVEILGMAEAVALRRMEAGLKDHPVIWRLKTGGRRRGRFAWWRSLVYGALVGRRHAAEGALRDWPGLRPLGIGRRKKAIRIGRGGLRRVIRRLFKRLLLIGALSVIPMGILPALLRASVRGLPGLLGHAFLQVNRYCTEYREIERL